jgi:hypothetical protein
MLCHRLQIDQARLLELGPHEWPEHLAEFVPERAAALLVKGEVVQFPADDARGLAVVKNAVAWTGVEVKQ